MADQGQNRFLNVLENMSYWIFRKGLNQAASCIIVKWFPGNLQEYSASLKRVILFFVTIQILGEDGKNMYMLVVRSGLWALMVF